MSRGANQVLNTEERKRIRRRIEQAGVVYDRDRDATETLALCSAVALHDAPRLLAALERTDAEIERLHTVVARLYKVVDLASLTECDHRCLTKETQNQLFGLLAEAKSLLQDK